MCVVSYVIFAVEDGGCLQHVACSRTRSSRGGRVQWRWQVVTRECPGAGLRFVAGCYWLAASYQPTRGARHWLRPLLGPITCELWLCGRCETMVGGASTIRCAGNLVCEGGDSDSPWELVLWHAGAAVLLRSQPPTRAAPPLSLADALSSSQCT